MPSLPTLEHKQVSLRGSGGHVGGSFVRQRPCVNTSSSRSCDAGDEDMQRRFASIVDSALAAARDAILEESRNMGRLSAPEQIVPLDSCPQTPVAASNVSTVKSCRHDASELQGQELTPQMRQLATNNRAMTLEEVIDIGTLGQRAHDYRGIQDRLRNDQTLQIFLSETSMAGVIVANIITMGLSSDIEWDGWIWVDAFFAFIFMAELVFNLTQGGLARFWREHRKRNMFDATLAVMSVVEVVLHFAFMGSEMSISVFRIVRLVRITRVVRIIRLEACADLLMMFNGAVGGVRTLLWSMILISVPIYAVALLLRETVGSEYRRLATKQVDATGTTPSLPGVGTPFESWHVGHAFSTLPWSFFSIFRCVVSQDCMAVDGSPIMAHLPEAYGWWYAVIYIVFMLMMTFGLFNVIVAIFVENTVAAAKNNELMLKRYRINNEMLVADKLRELVELCCEHWEARRCGGGRARYRYSDGAARHKEWITLIAAEIEITPPFLDMLVGDVRVQDVFKALDIQNSDTTDLFDTLDVDGGGTIDIKEMLLGLCKLRGDASRSDIVSVKLVVRDMQARLLDLQSSLEVVVHSIRNTASATSGQHCDSRDGLRRQHRPSHSLGLAAGLLSEVSREDGEREASAPAAQHAQGDVRLRAAI